MTTTPTGQIGPGPSSNPLPLHLNAPIVGIAQTADAQGYWFVGADGGVFAYGDARYFGSAVSFRPVAPIVGIAATADDGGYYLVAADGGVFAFGDGVFQGSMAGARLHAPIVAIATDPLTGGYRLAAADGGVFAFDAPFLGSEARSVLNGPVVGIADDSSTGGYWLAASDGGVFAFGSPFYGSWTTGASGPIVAIAAAPSLGYFLLDAPGFVHQCSPGIQEPDDPNPPPTCP